MAKPVRYVKSYPEVMNRVAKVWAGGGSVENGSLAKILGEWKQDRLRLCLDKDIFNSIYRRK